MRDEDKTLPHLFLRITHHALLPHIIGDQIIVITLSPNNFHTA